MQTTCSHAITGRAGVLLCSCLLLLAVAGCDPAVYENASLNGCYAQESLYRQLWFDGVEEFWDIYYNALSGTVSYGGVYRVEQNRLILEYYSYDPEYYDMRLYSDGFYLGSTWFEYTGAECD